MAIDVFLSKYNNAKNCEKPIFTIKENFYWYFFPYFEEISKSKGLTIDLYGDVVFNTGDLDFFKNRIVEADNFLKKQPEKFRLENGLNDFLDKRELEIFIYDFLNFIEKAKKESSYLIFIGD